MGRKQKKYHYIYKTTNVKNGKYYIGMHSTNDLNDGYMGSGKRLWNSINYHGKDNHVCEILEYCKDREELVRREEEIVNPELLNEDLCMNLTTGGAGFDVNTGKIANEIRNYKYQNDLEFREKLRKNISEGLKKGYENGREGKNYFSWEGKRMSEKTKKKMSESSKGQGKGSNNSQYGSCWITNEKENKKIMRGDVIPEGWRLGRVMKK